MNDLVARLRTAAEQSESDFEFQAMIAAADEIERLMRLELNTRECMRDAVDERDAEIKRLRAALEYIAALNVCNEYSAPNIARAALLIESP